MEDKKESLPVALYHAELGRMISTYVGRIHPAVIEKAMENRAIRTLETIRQILEDDRYDDPECFRQVDALITLFFHELEVQIGRHGQPG